MRNTPYFIFIFFFLFVTTAFARHEKVSYKEVPFKEFTVSLRLENFDDGSLAAKVEVRKSHQIFSSLNFEKIKSTGGHAAVYMSRRQHLEDVFLIYKFGDFNSRTILVNSDGKLFDLPGGEVFHDESAHLLFFLRNYETEPYAEYAAYDVKKKMILFHYKDSAKHHAFNDQLHYKVMKAGKLYYALSTNKDKGGAVEFDLAKKKVVRSTYAEVSKLKLVPLSNL
ncbi:MAG: hypothetical protein ACOYL6_06075 [Bacteriovoracaceae bacterium]